MVSDALHRPAREPAPSAARPTRRSARSLAPREHGAYGQLVLPLLVAHLAGSPSAAAWLLTVSAVATFAAHEPLLVVMGKRGQRARQEAGLRALRILVAASSTAAVAAVAGVLLAPAPARGALLGCSLLALLVVTEIVRGQERSLIGELLAATTLPALAVPVALSAGASVADAAGAWLVWTLGSAAATFAVRGTIAHFRGARPLGLRLVPIALVAAAAAGGGASGLLTGGQLVAASPMAGVSLALRPAHPRHLRRVGWTLVAASVATAVMLVAGAA